MIPTLNRSTVDGSGTGAACGTMVMTSVTPQAYSVDPSTHGFQMISVNPVREETNP